MKIPKEFLKPNTPNRLKLDKRLMVIMRDGIGCRKCGEVREWLLTTDHINPRANGGGNEIENLQILCKRCHRKKTHEDNIKYKLGYYKYAKKLN